MVLPEAETQRPSFPAFANQFEEVERIQTQHRMAAYFNNDNAPLSQPASSNDRTPFIISNINPPTPEFPLLPSPILQTRMDAAPSTPQERTPGLHTPGLHTPSRLPSRTPHPDDILFRRQLPPHLRVGIPSLPNSSHDATPAPAASHPQNQSLHPLSDRPYHLSRPALLLPPLPSSSLSSSALRTLLHSSPLDVSAPIPPPNRQLISLYALRVLPGDILAYGNKLNQGCTVTACFPDERRPDPVPTPGVRDRDGGDDEDVGEDVGYSGGPVKINGVVRIRWRDWRTGEELSQLFEELDVLMVRREDREEEGDYAR